MSCRKRPIWQCDDPHQSVSILEKQIGRNATGIGLFLGIVAAGTP